MLLNREQILMNLPTSMYQDHSTDLHRWFVRVVVTNFVGTT